MASLASESATMYEHIAMNRRVRHTIVRTDRNMLVTSPFFNEQAADAAVFLNLTLCVLSLRRSMLGGVGVFPFFFLGKKKK